MQEQEERIKEFKERYNNSGWTRRETAENLGKKLRSIEEYLRGNRVPTKTVILLFRWYQGVPPKPVNKRKRT